MPRENRKRGRRGEKRKHEEDDDIPEIPEEAKRRKSIAESTENGTSLEQDAGLMDAAYPTWDRPFFGMLDEEEQEYFKHADEMLELNSFADQDERNLFLANVYREAGGKELKIAQSQSCSRLMERLIRLSNSSQLKNLFQKFSGNFFHLINHRFASHCCEALFLRAAPLVSQELLQPPLVDASSDPDDIHVSMENLFLHVLAELAGNLGFLMAEKYASHVLRVLLLILAGDPVEEATIKQLLQSKRKETVTIQGAEESNLKLLEKPRTVPEAFTGALQKLIIESVAGLDTDKLRALATHPNGNPTLQLLLRLELTHFGKSRGNDEASLIRQLLPDQPVTAASGSANFINGIIYDPTGSHLVEQIIRYAPSRIFKSLYRECLKDRLPSFARNEIAGFVACQIIERLGRDDLFEVHEMLMPILPALLERNRTIVIRTLIQRCMAREVDTLAIAAQFERIFSGPSEFEIKKLLKWDQPADTNGDSPHDSGQSSVAETGTMATPTMVRPQEPAKAHFNVLAQSMLLVPGSLSALVLDALVQVDSTTLLAMSRDSIVGRTIQAALTTTNASIIQRRKLIQHFYGSIGEMSLDKAASHVVDCIWEGTPGLAFIRERIAEELAENEPSLRQSQYGRAIWRNWKMDLYKRRRADWVRQSKIKASNDGFQSFSEVEVNKKVYDKTPIEMARERHANKNKLSREKESRGRSKSKAWSSSGTTTTTSSNKSLAMSENGRLQSTAPTSTAASG